MAAETLRSLLGRVRYEVLPAKATEEKVLAHVPRDVVVTVTASPVKGLEPTLGLTERLAAGKESLAEVVAERTAAESALADAERRLDDAARVAARGAGAGARRL